MKFSEYASFDAVGLGELVTAREVSPDELLDVALERVELVNPQINAVVHDMADRAREQIALLVGGASRLAGVPYVLKDLSAMYAGEVTSHGSRFFSDFIPDYDSEIVHRLKGAGLVIFGKTNTPELGGCPSTEPQLFGPTRNPWNLNYSAGGSSGGSAAAVAAQIVPAGHGTDFGGSLRIPASCCGVFGLKPTRGRVSQGPRAGEVMAGISCEHAITRSVRDSAALLDIVSGPAVGDPYTCLPPEIPYFDEVGRDPGRLRIAASSVPPDGITVHPEVEAVFEAAVNRCRALGHEVDIAAPVYDMDAVSHANLQILAANYAQTISRYAQEKGHTPAFEDLERVMHHRVRLGESILAKDYISAVETMHQAGRAVASFMADYDIILRPTTAQPPPRIGYLDMNTEDLDEFIKRVWEYIPYTALFNATGQPAMSIPFGMSSEGLPIGVQFAARAGDEAILFRLAGQLEAEQPWPMSPMES